MAGVSSDALRNLFDKPALDKFVSGSVSKNLIGVKNGESLIHCFDQWLSITTLGGGLQLGRFNPGSPGARRRKLAPAAPDPSVGALSWLLSIRICRPWELFVCPLQRLGLGGCVTA
jgi:hypothetical protein